MKEKGFTLIELLVALMIFSMLAAAGVLLLGNSVSAQGAVKQRLEEQGDLLRVVALMEQDMAQALPRISRTENGLLAPAFFSRAPSDTEPFLHFVRGGWNNADNAPRANIQKVEYWLRDGRLERRFYPMPDGAEGGEPALLLDNVGALQLAFRDSKGEWLDTWQSQRPASLPVALRMTLTRRGQAPLTLMMRVGVGKIGRKDAEQGASVDAMGTVDGSVEGGPL
ncbi:MAG: type II secretion system protein GspJ [Sphingobium sp.]|nr:type II secretion system protein GspJ [Sphingobium sp.]